MAYMTRVTLPEEATRANGSNGWEPICPPTRPTTRFRKWSGNGPNMIASYEPEVAGQWAMTLPPGQDRDETLRDVYHIWPKEDPAAAEAAAAFAKLHGIK
jgi:hypothetical protein